MADYAISNVPRRVVYAASGVGPYAFTFEILVDTDVAVYKDDALLTLTTDYTVTIAANGTGSITLVATPTGATQIAIVGSRAIQRTSDFVTGGDFFANTVNDELDSLTIFAQQNAEGLARALQAPQTDPLGIDMTLPRASVRANKTLAFDTNGNPIIGEVIGDNRGDWAAGTAYNKRDIVRDAVNGNVYYANQAHTSSGVAPIDDNADAGKWDLLVDNESASASAAAAAASETAAAGSASAASTSATNAASSASAASTSATNAAASATSALASLNSFKGQYYGPAASDPAADPLGNAPTAGDLYFNTTSNRLRVYNATTGTWNEGNAGSVAVQNFNGTGSQTAFTLAAAPESENNTQVYISGVYQQKDQYSISGATLTFTSAPPAGTNNIEVVTLNTLPLGVTSADLVQFQPAGVGAVATTVQAKLREFVSVKDFGAVGDGVTDDTAAIQTAINEFPTHKRVIFFPSGTYRITAPINLRITGAINSDKLTLQGDSDLNTTISLDNNAAAGVFVYDSGWTKFDVANCSTTSGSAIVTTTGDFVAAGVVAGSVVSAAGIKATVLTVDSPTQITLDRNAYQTGTGTARFYTTLIGAILNRLKISDFFIKNTATTVAKNSWHSGVALNFNGVVNSEFKNIRIQSFTTGVKTLGGWINSFENVYAASCRDGFDIELATYRWHFQRCATGGSGDATVNRFGFKIVNSGGLVFVNTITEIDQLGMLLEGVRGCALYGGNWESTGFGYTLTIRGLPWALADENYWSQSIYVGSIRFYNVLGILAGNGAKHIRIEANQFEINNPPFTPSGTQWIRGTGEMNLVRDIDESGNSFPDGFDGISHILQPAASATLAFAQAFTRDGKRYVNGVPFYGKYWKVGDIVERLPSELSSGGTTGWVCTSASTGTDGSATWRRVGEILVTGGPNTYDPPSLADGAGATTTITANGAALGDYAFASFTNDLQGITLTAWVSATNTVSVRFQNESGGTIDLASGTLAVRVVKR
jgi:hypothetical protein